MDKHGVARKLLRLKEQLEEKQAERSEFQGEYNSLVSRLKTEFSLQELNEITERLTDLDTDIGTLDNSIVGIIEQVGGIFEGV